MRDLSAQRLARRLCRQDGRQEAAGRDRSTPRAGSSPCCAISSRRTTSSSIPGDQQAQVAEAPPYNRENAAFIQVPGPYDKGVTGDLQHRPAESEMEKAEQAQYIPSEATLMFTSVHEVWPGHFLQFLHSNSNPDKLEALWIGYAFAEGWAHYCEEMMYEEGLGQGRSRAAHRPVVRSACCAMCGCSPRSACRPRAWTVAQSEKMFREQAFQDPGNARQQAARGTYDPAYLNYTLGKLMIRKLRADWIAKMHSSVAAPAGGAPGGEPPAQPASAAMTGPAMTGPAMTGAPGAGGDQALMA